MKKTLLLIWIFTAAAGAVHAQQPHTTPATEEYHPSVYVLSTREIDTLYYRHGHLDEVISQRRLTARNVTQDYNDTHRPGFDQFHKPHVIFTTHNGKFSFALGGLVRVRTSYDFDGISDNANFVPYDIAVPANYNSQQDFNIDATNTRFFMKALTNTHALGRVMLVVEMDFTGGSRYSYTARMRSGYIALLGFTVGRDATTFCDLQSAPVTVDNQGPNCYTFKYTTLIRYEHKFANDRMKAGIALEMPELTATYNDHFAALHQRMPDIPFYVQYAWGQESHIRASGIVRNMYLRRLGAARNTSLTGWGVQLSGRMRLGKPLVVMMNGIYGQGIASYIQDLAGSGLDISPDPRNPDRMQTLPMWGWQLSGQLQLLPRLTLSGGYSTVRVQHRNGILSPREYRRGQYVFGNLFYSFNTRCKVAAEYNYGAREDMDLKRSHANRVSVMIQYSF